MQLQYKTLGDQGIQIIFGTMLSEQMCLEIQALSKLLHQQKHLPIYECVPAYTTLSIYYDSRQLSYAELVREISDLVKHIELLDPHLPYVFEIPIIYGEEFGPDLIDIAKLHQLEIDEVIRIHSKPYYLIYMLGFTPGFPYLGGDLDRLATPRLANPRIKVAAGSVGIAGTQTGIYPIESPGGWRILGRTPLQLYRPEHERPFLLEAGHYIKFVPIDRQAFQELSEAWAKDEQQSLHSYPYPYSPRISSVEGRK